MPSIEILSSIAFDLGSIMFDIHLAGQIPVKNDLNTVAEGGENEATLRPHSLLTKTSCQPVRCRAPKHLPQSNAIESQSNQSYIEIRLRSTIKFQPFNWFDRRICSIEIVWELTRVTYDLAPQNQTIRQGQPRVRLGPQHREQLIWSCLIQANPCREGSFL